MKKSELLKRKVKQQDTEKKETTHGTLEVKVNPVSVSRKPSKREINSLDKLIENAINDWKFVNGL